MLNYHDNSINYKNNLIKSKIRWKSGENLTDEKLEMEVLESLRWFSALQLEFLPKNIKKLLELISWRKVLQWVA